METCQEKGASFEIPVGDHMKSRLAD